MSKLTVASLFHSVRALNVSHGISPRSAHLIGENLWRLTAEADSAQPHLDLHELLSAVQFVFEENREEPSSKAGDFVAWRLQQAERQLRFDQEHRLLDGRAGGFERRLPEPARQALRRGLGEAQARERLGQQHWIVILVDAQASSSELPADLLQGLRGLRQALVLWCDEQPLDAPSQFASPSATAFEQLSLDSDLICLGPIGGLEADGLVAVLEALKALEKPAILHLRLRPRSPAPNQAEGRAPANGFSELRAKTPDRAGGARALNLAIDGWLQLARNDQRCVAANLLAMPASHEAACRLAEAGVAQRAADADAVAWCAGVADGGCRPFLFLDEAALARSWGPLVELILDPQKSATLIVAPPSEDSDVASLLRNGTNPLRLAPHLPLAVPRDSAEFASMLASTAVQPGPAVIVLPAGLTDEPVAVPNAPAEFGRAALLRAGSDVALLAIGDGVSTAMDAAGILERQGIEAAVVDLRFLRPLDASAVLDAVGRTPLSMLVTEELDDQGLHAELSELFRRRGLAECAIAPRPRIRLNGDDRCDRRSREVADLCLERLRARRMAAVATAAKLPGIPRVADATNGERSQILAVQLSPPIARWVDEYSKLGRRGLYLWKWCRHGLALTTLPTVLPELHDDVCDTKLLSILLCVLLDDVADQHGKRQLLEILVDPSAPRSEEQLFGLSEHEQAYAKFTWRVWEDYFARVRRYPRYDDFAELLHFDLLQLSNTLRYSHLLNDRLCLLNLAEHDLYSPHNIMMVNFATLDLMCSPDFPMSEVGRLREAVWHAQCMGRIGNLLSTWRREIGDRDFTSGVFARAVMEGDLTVDQLVAGEREQIEDVIRHGGHEEHFIRRWHEHRENFHNRIAQIRMPGMNRLLEGHDKMFRMHVGNEGLI